MKQRFPASANKHLNALFQRIECSLHGIHLGGMSGVDNTVSFFVIQMKHAGKLNFTDALLIHRQVEWCLHRRGDRKGNKMFVVFCCGGQRNSWFIVNTHFYCCFQSTGRLIERMFKGIGNRVVIDGSAKSVLTLRQE